jgi:hypothetical protein
VRLSINNRQALIALAIVVAFVAIVVPTCRMVGCSMSGATPWGHHGGVLGMYSDCGGTYVTNTTPVAVVPSGADALTLALVSAVMGVVALAKPPVVVQTIASHASDPPPPPEDPRGERLRV